MHLIESGSLALFRPAGERTHEKNTLYKWPHSTHQQSVYNLKYKVGERARDGDTSCAARLFFIGSPTGATMEDVILKILLP